MNCIKITLKGSHERFGLLGVLEDKSDEAARTTDLELDTVLVLLDIDGYLQKSKLNYRIQHFKSHTLRVLAGSNGEELLNVEDLLGLKLEIKNCSMTKLKRRSNKFHIILSCTVSLKRQRYLIAIIE